VRYVEHIGKTKPNHLLDRYGLALPLLLSDPPVVRCHDPTTGSTSDLVGDLVHVSNVSGGCRAANGLSRTGKGDRMVCSVLLNGVGDKGLENAEDGNGGESKRGKPVSNPKIV
jgi:hypothetical protein